MDEELEPGLRSLSVPLRGRGGVVVGAVNVCGPTSRVALRELGEMPPRDLKGIAEAILAGGTADLVAVVSTAEGKASVLVALGDAAKGRADAVALVRAAAAAVGGKGGGGKPDMAQAGGPDATKAPEALAAIRAALAG